MLQGVFDKGVEERDGTIRSMKILVNARPNAKVSRVEQLPDGSCRVAVKEPPREGRANAAIAAALAEHLGKRRQDVILVSGFASRHKIFEVVL